MRYGNVEVGDIIFFESRPDTDYPFAQKNMSNQRCLSWLFFGCCGSDHRKTHVAICVEKEEKGSIKVAHLRAGGYQISSLGEPDLAEKLKKGSFVIMRPKNAAFKKEFLRLAKLENENKAIQWDQRSYDESVACCCGSNTETRKTASDFSVESTCSLFVLEAVNVAAKNSNLPSYVITKPNLSVMQLYWALQSSKQYQQLAQDETLANSKAKTNRNKDNGAQKLLLAPDSNLDTNKYFKFLLD